MPSYGTVLKHKGAVQPPQYVWSEVTARNLLTYSEEQDNAAWTKTGVTVSANAVVDSQGELTADKLVENTATSLHGSRGLSLTNVNHEPITVYAEVKAAERTLCDVWAINSSQTIGYGVRVDLTDGSVGSTRSVGGVTMTDYRVDDLGNGWYGVWVTAKTATTSARSLLVNAIATGTATSTSNYTGDGSSGIYVARCAAVERVQLGFPYYKTTDSIIDDERRRTQSTTDWSPSDPVTNLLYYGDFSAGWGSETNNTFTATNHYVPGIVGGHRAFANTDNNDAGGGSELYALSTIIGQLDSPTYGRLVSVYAKASTHDQLLMRMVAVGADLNADAYFDLTAGTVGTTAGESGVAAAIQEVVGAPGWYRCILQSGTTTSDTNWQIRFTMAEADNDRTVNVRDGKEIFLANPMLEDAAGTTPSQYVPTDSASSETFTFDTNVVYMFKGAGQPTKISSSSFMDGSMTADEYWRRRRMLEWARSGIRPFGGHKWK
jgi:hypothetical protein